MYIAARVILAHLLKSINLNFSRNYKQIKNLI